MVKPTKGFLSIATVAALGALAACGTASTGTSSGSTSTGIAGCKGTITVATDLPLTGGDATDGPYVQMAAELAVTQANAQHLMGGCTLKYESKDDSTVLKDGHDPAQGEANITALAADATVVGVVGPFNSSVALAEIPVASQNDLALISPSNTNPCLTVVVAVCSDPTININTAALYPAAHSYFRVIASDVQQGEIDAYVAAKVLNATKAYVIDDQEAYGRGLALLFTKAYTTTEGGTIVGSASLPGTTTSFATQVSLAQSEGAQVIFFGGTSGNGCGLVRRDMISGGLNIPLLGGDGCQDTKSISDADSGSNKTASVGMYATSAPDVTKLSSAATFYSAYASTYASVAAPYNNAMNEPYTPYGYDAMNILLQAIHSVIVANGGQLPASSQTFRGDVVAQLRLTSYDGALGHTSFDANGDTTNTGFTLYKVAAGAWTGDGTYAVDTSGNVSLSS
ncbi:MAG: branched-chain amino acid ABC transporter substrate-binding protein [Candidatus Dormibacteria bacterium]|jgi:branched-chain amino acid transport system substrate-binding protein